MKWRFGVPEGHGGGRYLWVAGARWRLYRVMVDPRGGWWVPGLTRPAGSAFGIRHERRTYHTVYGARMAAEAAEQRRRGRS